MLTILTDSEEVCGKLKRQSHFNLSIYFGGLGESFKKIQEDSRMSEKINMICAEIIP